MSNQRFKKRKKANNKRGLILIAALAIILYMWFNAESLMTAIFSGN